MTKVALRAYDHEIESMIEQGQRLDEAVAHCRHILATYPKHLGTYRLLGKAYLEAKRYDQAVDIFQRVLVAAPDDFVSHVGMSIIADDQGKLDESIWHMERAFEVQPSNAAIQSELQRLFGRRDGVEPPKIRLTRGALAQMYVQGDLYSQAISEIQAVLANDPDRMDMQVLLAKALARNGQKAEAVDACSTLLEISPYCLDANRLMAEILPGTESSQAADEYRRRVVELDPYAAHATGTLFDLDTVPDGAVTLQRLVYLGTANEPGAEAGFASPSRTAEQAAAIPSWLSSGPPATPSIAAPPGPKEDLPEFLRGSGWREVPEGSEGEVDGLGFVSSAEAEPEVVPGALPDWVRSLAPADSEEGAGRGSGSEESLRGAGDWRPVALPGEPADNRAEEETEDDTPDWLRELAGSDLRSANESGGRAASADGGRSQDMKSTERTGDDGGLAWLEGLAEKHGAKPDELTTSPESRAADPPDWIANLRQDQAMAPEDWRTEPDDGDGSEAAVTGVPWREESATPKPAGSMDWLSDLAEPDAFAGMERSGEGASAPTPRGPTSGARPGPTADDSLPDWLVDKPTGPKLPPAAPRLDPSTQPGSGVELPGWLAEFDGTPEPGAAENAASPAPQWLPNAGESDDSRSTAAQRPSTQAAPVHVPVPDMAPSEPELTPIGPLPPDSPQGAPPVRLRAAQAAPVLDATWLASAKAELARGNIAAAMDMYSRLIRRGRGLTDIIRELREALYRFPVEVPIWQALGDAYMRANSLQEALDAYTKAEELLR